MGSSIWGGRTRDSIALASSVADGGTAARRPATHRRTQSRQPAAQRTTREIPLSGSDARVVALPVEPPSARPAPRPAIEPAPECPTVESQLGFSYEGRHFAARISLTPGNGRGLPLEVRVFTPKEPALAGLDGFTGASGALSIGATRHRAGSEFCEVPDWESQVRQVLGAVEDDG